MTADKKDVWQGTLALMVLKTLDTLGPQHGYGIARRIEQTSGDLLAPLMMASQSVRRNTPRAIADMTGGEYELFSSRKSFERLLTEFTNHLQSRYLLSFEPRDPHAGLHAIRVQLRNPEKRSVLARNSYWAEAAR